MNDDNVIDYGPLTELIGRWSGINGTDIAPDPDGIENNPYHETITFTAIGDVTNAESQELAAIHYRQVVHRSTDDKLLHDETGYWMWDAANRMIMHSLTIPRGLCLLAGGKYNGETTSDGNFILQVSATSGDENWPIIQSQFMLNNALTKEFHQKIIIGDEQMSYSQTTLVDIYGKLFEHTDESTLFWQTP